MKKTISRKKTDSLWLSLHSYVRVSIAVVIAFGLAYVCGLYTSWVYSPLVFWDSTALILMGMLWLSLRTMSAAQTKAHATDEDPGRGKISIVMVFTSVISLASVFFLIIKAASDSGIDQALDIGLGLGSVFISWTVVHMVYMLRYADVYFQNPSGIDFNSDSSPCYQDFAYLSFTIGMTYQVSDTSLTTTELRKLARQHAMLSYVFGTVIIATTINAVAGLGR